MLSLLVRCSLKYERNSMNASTGSSRILKKNNNLGLDKLCRGKSQAVDVHVDSTASDAPCCSRNT